VVERVKRMAGRNAGFYGHKRVVEEVSIPSAERGGETMKARFGYDKTVCRVFKNDTPEVTC